MLSSPLWVYFGLIGGGMYLYFAGRGIVVRKVMQRRSVRIGSPGTLRVVYTFLALWGLAAVITIIMAIVAISVMSYIVFTSIGYNENYSGSAYIQAKIDSKCTDGFDECISMCQKTSLDCDRCFEFHCN